MSIPIPLRSDFEAATVRRIAKATKNAAQGRRLLALAEIYEAAASGCGAHRWGRLQTLRDWVLAFNAEGPDGLIDGKAPGNPSKLNDAQRQALVRVVESGPIPAIHGVVSGVLRPRPLARAWPGSSKAGVRRGGCFYGPRRCG